ncbi:MAG: chorion class high-cysteine HCB protein 13 [Eubacterium sp.]|nr:chorion class high-cysteine HCB protein 13 [Eubacterium sp.]
MSDLSATQCGGGCSCNEGCGNSSCWIIILLLLCCGGCGGNGISTLGGFGGDNCSCSILYILLLISCFCGGNNGGCGCGF